MNKERYNQIIDISYESYLSKAKNQTTEDLFSSMIKGDEIIHGMLEAHTRDFIPYTREQFIDKCKTDKEFSERWGLKIEERELSWEDRRDLLTPNQYDGTELNKYGKEDCGFGYISPFTDKVIHYWLDLHNIPTKLITLIYNNETIESYE